MVTFNIFHEFTLFERIKIGKKKISAYTSKIRHLPIEALGSSTENPVKMLVKMVIHSVTLETVFLFDVALKVLIRPLDNSQ